MNVQKNSEVSREGAKFLAIENYGTVDLQLH